MKDTSFRAFLKMVYRVTKTIPRRIKNGEVDPAIMGVSEAILWLSIGTVLSSIHEIFFFIFLLWTILRVAYWIWRDVNDR